MKTNPPTYLLKLKALSGFGWSLDPVIRLRALLKASLRHFGFRCLAVSECTEGPDGSEIHEKATSTTPGSKPNLDQNPRTSGNAPSC